MNEKWDYGSFYINFSGRLFSTSIYNIYIYTTITSFVLPFVFRHLLDCCMTRLVSFIGGSLSRLSVSVTIQS